MAHDPTLDRIAALAVRNDPRNALALADRAAAEGVDPAALAAVRALARFIAADYPGAVTASEEALLLSPPVAGSSDSGSGVTGSTDPSARLLACAARLMASAGHVWAADEARAEGLAAELWELREGFVSAGRWGSGGGGPAAGPALPAFAVALCVEALFATGRVALAAQALDAFFPGHDWSAEPLIVAGSAAGVEASGGDSIASIPFLPVRLLFFSGRSAEAEALLQRVLARPEVRAEPVWCALGESLIGLCAGSRGDRAAARRAESLAAGRYPSPRTYLEASARILAAYGIAACGDLARAADAVRAAGGAGLRRL
ncbi:MAG: hypothetical protein QM606_02380, partial [Leucobacter sp.]